MKTLLDSANVDVNDDNRELLESVRSQIEREESSFAERFPSVETEHSPQETVASA